MHFHKNMKTPLKGRFQGSRISLPAEPVDGLAVVGLTSLGERLRPLGVVHGIGVELGFQSHAAALAIVNAALAGFVQEVSCIELNARAVGVHSHGASGAGILQHGAGAAEDLPVVVIAALQVQGLIVGANVPADGLGDAEVHGGTGNAALFAGGDVLGIIGGEEPSGDGQQLIHGAVRLLLACQIEIGVVGQIEHGVLVRNGIIDDVQPVGGIQLVGDPDHRIAGEALIHVGAIQPEGDGGIGDILRSPQAGVVAIGAGVEIVALFVGGQGDRIAVQAEAGSLYTVGISAHGCAQVGGAAQIAFCIVIAQSHVRDIALGVRDHHADQGCPKICAGCRDAATGYGVEICFLPIGQSAENCFH